MTFQCVNEDVRSQIDALTNHLASEAQASRSPLMNRSASSGVARLTHAPIGGLKVVTVSVDRLSFLAPCHVGDHVVLRASTNYVGRTSLEVGVQVRKENPFTGEQIRTTSAYLTFVALMVVVDYAWPVEFRSPPRYGILVPYLLLFFGSILLLGLPMFRLNRRLWLVTSNDNTPAGLSRTA